MTQDLDLVPTNKLLDALKQPFACIGATQFLKVKIEQYLLHNIQDNE